MSFMALFWATFITMVIYKGGGRLLGNSVVLVDMWNILLGAWDWFDDIR